AASASMGASSSWPIAVVRMSGPWRVETSAGGLVNALRGVKDVEAKWIGWADVNIPDEVGQRALAEELTSLATLNLSNSSVSHGEAAAGLEKHHGVLH
uniref:Uncharacterized protein n=2 Tax=Aegilops tauschii subsp. strangulata TaxID=200361 RepID=A0A453D835_AEGTS